MPSHTSVASANSTGGIKLKGLIYVEASATVMFNTVQGRRQDVGPDGVCHHT